MEWTDDAFVLAARPHGENALIVSMLTRERGRHAGIVQGGLSRGKRPLYEPGNQVVATWRARLSEHLGAWQCELTDTASARFIDDPVRLSALASAAAVAVAVAAAAAAAEGAAFWFSAVFGVAVDVVGGGS